MSDHSSSDLQSHKKAKNFSPRNTPSSIGVFFYKCSQLFIILLFQVFILHFIFRAPSKSVTLRQDVQEKISQLPLPESESCEYGMVYVYNLPAMFNQELLDNCRDLDPWHSRCNAISNQGLGPKATALSGVPENLVPAWYWTDMFAGEVIYHARILKHKCRTTEPESATAFYIPFYAGLAVGKYLFTNYTAKERDMHCERLLRWVHDQPPWRRSNGSDHFIVLGRMTRDEVRKRREKVISLIPKIVYSFMPNDEVGSAKDAFDVAIDGVLRRFQEQKWKKNGKSIGRMKLTS
ncbi:hypothetical protein Pfo_008630 [Paulownia fortunei]|nr:hypothetical protein Pfo_008630 [Paulownia fortunei]